MERGIIMMKVVFQLIFWSQIEGRFLAFVFLYRRKLCDYIYICTPKNQSMKLFEEIQQANC